MKKLFSDSGLSSSESAAILKTSTTNLYNLYKKDSIESKYMVKAVNYFGISIQYFFEEEDVSQKPKLKAKDSMSEEVNTIVENLQKLVNVLEKEVSDLRQDKEDLRKDKDRAFNMLEQALLLKGGMLEGKDEASDAGHSSLAKTAKVIKLEELQPMKKTG